MHDNYSPVSLVSMQMIKWYDLNWKQDKLFASKYQPYHLSWYQLHFTLANIFYSINFYWIMERINKYIKV